MVIEPRLLPLTQAQLNVITRVVQGHFRRLFFEIANYAQSVQNPAQRIVVYGSTSPSTLGRGMTGSDLFYLMKRGAFQSEMGFPKRYNPERQVAKALQESMETKAWRSGRTIRLMRIMWELNYDRVLDKVAYRSTSGSSKGQNIYWLKFLDGESVTTHGFLPLSALRAGMKGAAAMGQRGVKRPRAYGRPGVGAMYAGYMIKGHGPWTLSSRANPLGVKGDWYKQGLVRVAPAMFSYWKKRIIILHNRTVRMHKSQLGSFI